MYLKAEHFGKVFINVVLRFLIFTFCQCFVSKYKSIFSEWIKVLYVNYLHGQQTKFIKKLARAVKFKIFAQYEEHTFKLMK